MKDAWKKVKRLLEHTKYRFDMSIDQFDDGARRFVIKMPVYKYEIVVDDVYMGAMFSQHRSVKGGDLHDGKASEETLLKILADILACESSAR